FTMDYIISGIQQLGVGQYDSDAAWNWYLKHIGADVPIFIEEAEAALMLPHTNGKVCKRYAILAMNMNGGGGFEIWQHKGHQPVAPKFEIQWGDLGIFVGKLKSYNVYETYKMHRKQGVNLMSEVHNTPDGRPTYYFHDHDGNIFQVVHSDDWFQKKRITTGGIYGATFGVSDVEQSLPLYQKLLGYDRIVYDETGVDENLQSIPGGGERYRRVLLRHTKKREGAFAPLLGDSEIELVQALDRTGRKIYEGRIWGDPGFIHLCFDIQKMDNLKQRAADLGFPFTVDSGHFDMGDAAGRFAYIEDPDGALIEFVETYKVPVAKKIGFYINLQGRNPYKPLPRWMLKALGFNRKKG
ncbi:MAG: VOC family protein, partial [Bacteroidota bacterium]